MPTPLVVLVIVIDRLPFSSPSHTPKRPYADTPISSPTADTFPRRRHVSAPLTPPSNRVPGKSGKSPCRSADPAAQCGFV
jgi:hypothetical protein